MLNFLPLREPLAGEIEPRRVERLDEGDFLIPAPAFDLFLAGDSGMNILKSFNVNKSVYIVFRGKAFVLHCLVVNCTTLNIVRYTNIQCASL